MLNKYGSPVSIKVVKTSSFSLDINVIVSKVETALEGKKTIEISVLHDLLKTFGIEDYSPEDMHSLLHLLKSRRIIVLS